MENNIETNIKTWEDCATSEDREILGALEKINRSRCKFLRNKGGAFLYCLNRLKNPTEDDETPSFKSKYYAARIRGRDYLEDFCLRDHKICNCYKEK